MAYKLRYRVKIKFDEIILNRRVMLMTALASPVVFAVATAYLAGFLDNIKFPKMINSRDRNVITAGDREATISAKKELQQKSVFADKLNPIYTEAKKLKLDSVKTEINLVELGVTDEGVLEVPTKWSEGGWYKYGAKPGENGNLIINAHFDDNYGKPAAFWQLKNVKIGDKVSVSDKYSKVYTYSVTDSFFVSINDPNRLEIFEDREDKAEITLVTCGGVWLPGKSTYDKRLVVKAEILKQAYVLE